MGLLLARGGVPIVLVVLFLTFSFLLPGTFATFSNVTAMIASTSSLLILSMALIIPLRSGDFDLSIAATMGLSAALVGVLTVRLSVPVIPAVLIALVAGALIGAINGALIVGAGINAFIATLGMLTVLSGLTYAVTGNTVIINLPESLQDFWRHQFLGLPVAVWIGWVLAAALFYVFEYTPIGRYLQFVGGNREAALLSGIPVRGIRFGSFIAAGLLSALAGVALAGAIGAVDPSVAPAYLLPPYSAAFLGTTTILVGRFNVVGTILGLYLVTVGITGLQLLGVESWIGEVFNGLVLILAVLAASLGSRLVNRRKA